MRISCIFCYENSYMAKIFRFSDKVLDNRLLFLSGYYPLSLPISKVFSIYPLLRGPFLFTRWYAAQFMNCWTKLIISSHLLSSILFLLIAFYIQIKNWTQIQEQKYNMFDTGREKMSWILTFLDCMYLIQHLMSFPRLKSWRLFEGGFQKKAV